MQTVKYTLPNKHYIPVDMRYAGIDNLTPCVISPLLCLSFISSLFPFPFALFFALYVRMPYGRPRSCPAARSCLLCIAARSASRVPSSPISIAIGMHNLQSAICNLPDPHPSSLVSCFSRSRCLSPLGTGARATGRVIVYRYFARSLCVASLRLRFVVFSSFRLPFRTAILLARALVARSLLLGPHLRRA